MNGKGEERKKRKQQKWGKPISACLLCTLAQGKYRARKINVFIDA